MMWGLVQKLRYTLAALLASEGDSPAQLFLRNLVSGLVLYGGLLAFYFQNKWYLSFLDDRTRALMSGLLLFWLCWTALGAAFWIFVRNENFRSVPQLFFDALGNALRHQTLTHAQKTNILKIGVKGFFFPLMLHWVLGNFDQMAGILQDQGFQVAAIFSEPVTQIGIFISLNFEAWYRFIFNAFIFVDVLVFCVAYAVESEWLDNKIKSVEPTLLGWVVALLCYPPLNDFTGSYITWHSNENDFHLGPIWFDQTLHILVLTLFAWYLWATLSLGFKAGNLVNRGIVSSGAYRWTRHPAYFSKVTAWWIAGLPAIWSGLVMFASAPGMGNFVWLLSVLLSISAWTFIYSLRAWTEERHLSQDPDYVAYKKKVPFVAIPGLI